MMLKKNFKKKADKARKKAENDLKDVKKRATDSGTALEQQEGLLRRLQEQIDQLTNSNTDLQNKNQSLERLKKTN